MIVFSTMESPIAIGTDVTLGAAKGFDQSGPEVDGVLRPGLVSN
jgi:hypothetical protein